MNSGKNIIKINARKFDSRIHRSWKCEFVEQRDSLLIFVGRFETEVSHKDLGKIEKGTVSYEYYWLDRWYNVFRFHEPDGNLRNFYCNVNLPPQFKNGILDYIDLDIDVLVWRDFSFDILDIDEFQSNSVKFKYPAETIAKAESSLSELLQMIENRSFPFDFDDSKI